MIFCSGSCSARRRGESAMIDPADCVHDEPVRSDQYRHRVRHDWAMGGVSTHVRSWQVRPAGRCAVVTRHQMPNEPPHPLIELGVDIDQVKRFERITRRRDRAHSQQPNRAEIPLLSDRSGTGRHEQSSCQSALINNPCTPTSGTRLSASAAWTLDGACRMIRRAPPNVVCVSRQANIPGRPLRRTPAICGACPRPRGP